MHPPNPVKPATQKQDEKCLSMLLSMGAPLPPSNDETTGEPNVETNVRTNDETNVKTNDETNDETNVETNV